MFDDSELEDTLAAQAAQKATSIGPPQPGTRLQMPVNPTTLDLIRQLLGGERPQSVAAQDPYGIEAWLKGAGNPPLMAGETSTLPGKITDSAHPAMNKLLQMLHDFAAPSSDVADTMHPMDVFKQFQGVGAGKYIPPDVVTPELQAARAAQQEFRGTFPNKPSETSQTAIRRARLADPENKTPKPKKESFSASLRGVIPDRVSSAEDLANITPSSTKPTVPVQRTLTAQEQRAKQVAEDLAKGKDAPSSAFNRGTGTKRGRLTVDDVKEIRNAFKDIDRTAGTGRRSQFSIETDGPTAFAKKMEEITKAKGLKPQTVVDIIKKRSWGWVKD